MKIRIKFAKEGFMKFVGHLDFMRSVQKNFRRSGIPIAYSEGFNPHQIFSIASPLGVGTTSEGEYLDLKLEVEEYNLEELLERINDKAPEGVRYLDAYILQAKETAAMAACHASDYIINLSSSLAGEIGELARIEEFFKQEEILISKKNKKGKIREIDIKKGVFEYEISLKQLKVRLATGSSFNVKPQILVKALLDFCDIELEKFSNEKYYMVHRLETYKSVEPLLNLINK